MFVYSVFFSFTVGLLFLARKVGERQSSALTYVVFACLILFAGLRGLVGSDTLSYLQAYESLSSLENFLYLLGKMEPLFVLVLSIHKYLFDSPFFYLFMMSAFQALLLWKVCENSSNKSFFLISYVLIFYLNFHFNIARSAVATMLFLYALTSRSKGAGILAAAFAPGFHVSVLFFYPLLFLRLRLNHVLVVLLLFLAFCGVFYQEIYDFSLKFMKYGEYLQGSSSGISIYGLLVMANVFVSVILFHRASVMFFGAALFLIMALLIYSFYPIGYRLVTVALLLYLFFLLEVLSAVKYSWYYMFFWAPVLLTFGAFVYAMTVEAEYLNARIADGEPRGDALESTYIPYEFYWVDKSIDDLILSLRSQ